MWLSCPSCQHLWLSCSQHLCTPHSSVSADLQLPVPCSVCLTGLQLDQLDREFGRLGSAGSRSAAVTQLITKEKEVQQSAVKLHSQQEQLGPQVKSFSGHGHTHGFQCRNFTVQPWTESIFSSGIQEANAKLGSQVRALQEQKSEAASLLARLLQAS